MSLPSEMIHVEWEIAKDPDRPFDRTQQSRNYTKPENAGRQVRIVRSWSPSHAKVLGVWRTCGYQDRLSWEAVDPDSLPVPPMTEARCTVMEAVRAGRTPEEIGAMPEYRMLTTDEMDEDNA